MDVNDAREIFERYQGKTYEVIPEWLEASLKAKGFLEGWNARGEKDAVVVDNYHDITVDDGVYLKRAILNLSVEEGK